MNNTPEPKQYSLTPHEANMLRFVSNHQNAIFSGLLSTIAMSRLGYTVTEHTQFNLSGDFSTMTLTELNVPEETKESDASDADDSAKSPVVTAPEQPTEEADDAQERVNQAVADENKAAGFDADGNKQPEEASPEAKSETQAS